ncbi:cholecystokinin receptor type A-like [Mercenaria mercenaria]|uniref:cholecystokinin receptor type A-like n=1 Tax=Mercenaria mercenaria TaxID=6596 RepID=UPI001E1DCFC5|nr:cholecystokinin receptor type A-like [Mercenaria mercenaria]XP_045181338.1 cholecystokinin receptor type A-like [Mercenaria mercenaria]XP_045181339.1 cholecystokinin receptor type A-like [Mercenaria mercenaria]XP_045181340.1 cholecystokinin receptor type A-like [Mercenaria mercenaria]XP_045181341.1 cholecystokinin receptor type A-like [Mercenaria mercenaria]XP_045181342.1 cholecystokinin receptor type A-like [Mercenaria mercenaria]
MTGISADSDFMTADDQRTLEQSSASYVVSHVNMTNLMLSNFANSTSGGFKLDNTGIGGGRVTSGFDITSDSILATMNDSQFRILTPSFILVCILLALGVPGNAIALLVYITKMKRSTASYFIITLAFSDLINCIISLPVELYLISHFWTFDFPWLCKFSRFLTAAMNNTSSFVLAAIAVERFRSICLPLKPRISSLCCKFICVSLLVCACLSAVPMIFGYGTFTYKIESYNVTVEAKTCLIDDRVLNTSYPNILLLIFFVGHIIIFIILAVLYTCIARKLIAGTKFNHSETATKNVLLQRQNSAYSITSFTKESRTSVRLLSMDVEQTPNGKRKLLRSTSSQSNIEFNLSRKHGGHHVRTKRLTCMLFLVTSVFEISFIPYLVVVCIRNQHPDLYGSLSFPNKMAYQFFLRFYMINCAMNPVIYCFYNQNFRHGVKRLFYGIKDSVLNKIVS